MTNKEFLKLMLANDNRKDIILVLLSDSFGHGHCNPLALELTEDYKTSWEMFIPGMLACSSNNEYHIAHTLGSDLTNIRYEFLRNQNDISK